MNNMDINQFLDLKYKSFNSNIIPSFKFINEQEFDNSFEYEYQIICKPSWGYTFGNTIRRVALTSVAGFAPVAFNVKGAKHLFDQIPGTKEVMGDILLTLKNLKIKPKRELNTEDIYTISLERKEHTGIIYNAHLENDDFEIINKGDVLVSMDKNASFQINMLVACGVGYRKASEHVIDNLAAKFFPIDTNFSFISRCSFDVQHETSLKDAYDSVKIKLYSKIPCDPDKLITDIINVVINEFKSFVHTDVVVQQKKELKIEKNIEKWHSCLIDNIGLQMRTKNTLKNNNINTIEQLLKYSAEEIRSLNGVGETSFEDILKFLNENSLRLKNSQDRFTASNHLGKD